MPYLHLSLPFIALTFISNDLSHTSGNNANYISMEISPFLSWDRSVSLRVCAAAFVYVSLGRVSGSDGAGVKVHAETTSYGAFSPTGCIDSTAPREWLPWWRALAVCLRRHIDTCAHVLTAMVEWINEIAAVGVESKRFHLLCLLSSSALLLTECQCWMLRSSPPKDKIRTTCSSYLLARESQADLLTHAPRFSPPLSCLSLMSGKWKVVPWQLALDYLPEGVRFKRSGLFPFSLMCIFHPCVAAEECLAHLTWPPSTTVADLAALLHLTRILETDASFLVGLCCTTAPQMWCIIDTFDCSHLGRLSKHFLDCFTGPAWTVSHGGQPAALLQIIV